MKIVFDTNVLISGLITATGISQYVFNLALKRHTVILSEYILEELEGKLVEKLKLPGKFAKEAADFLRNRAVILDVLENPELKFSDKKDIPILSLVEFSKPHYFISGDKKLIELKKFGTALFLSPREAVEILEK